MGYDIPQLTKQPSESRLYNMDFSANMSAGETITGVNSSVATPTGLTLGSPTFSGQVAQLRVSGGTDGTTYKVTLVVTTSLGNTLEGEGNLFVMDK